MSIPETKIAMNYISVIERRYNPEWDIISGSPSVTHTDYQLMLALESSLESIRVLERRIHGLENKVRFLESREVAVK